MKTICFNCGQRVALDGGVPGQTFACPACGATNTLPVSSPDSLTPESERDVWQQKRRRVTAMIAVAIVLLLASLTWLLLHPSGRNSAARQVKNAVFGNRVTEAAEQAAQSGEGSGSSEGQGQGQGQSGNGQQGQGNNAGGQSGERGNSEGTDGRSGGNRSGAANGNGQRAGAVDGGAVNDQSPRQNGAGGIAPPERSIGWLDRFFGAQERSGPIQAGEGGTGTERRSSGNSNATIARPTNEPIAAEVTQAEPSSPLETIPVVPPPRAPDTNRVVPGTLNDNLEQLLRQHRAGSGDIRISLMWNNRNDIDLHVIDPSGEEIYYNHRRARSGGLLDIDMNASLPLRAPAVENIFWPDRAAPAGTYRVYVNHYTINDRVNDTDFTVRVLIRGRTADFPGRIRFGERKRLVHQFTLETGN